MQSGIVSTTGSLLCSLTQHSWKKQLTPDFKAEAPVAAVSLLAQKVLNVPAWGQSQPCAGPCGILHLPGAMHSQALSNSPWLLTFTQLTLPWITKGTRIARTGGFGGRFCSSLCSCYTLALPT